MEAKDYWALTGVKVPKGKLGICDVPNLSNRKLYVFPVNIRDVVMSFIRFRLRKCKGDNFSNTHFYDVKLPEFSNYALERILDAAGKLDPFPDAIWKYIQDGKAYYPDLDSQRFVKMCKSYAGLPPITKQHVIKVLHMAGYMAVRLTRKNYRTLTIINQMEKVCIEKVLGDGEYLEFINGYPLHSWFYPLETFQVTNEEVVMSVVRSRIVKKFDLAEVLLRSLYNRFPDLNELFRKDLPEYTSYQIRCVIDELEDMDESIDKKDLLWIKGYRPSKDNVNEYLNKIMKTFQDKRGPQGILKAFHTSCLVIENLLERAFCKPAATLLKTLIYVLNSDKHPFKNILAQYPWHSWYKQYLPNPVTERQRYSSFDRCKYLYPQFVRDSNELGDEDDESPVESPQTLDHSAEIQQGSNKTPIQPTEDETFTKEDKCDEDTECTTDQGHSEGGEADLPYNTANDQSQNNEQEVSNEEFPATQQEESETENITQEQAPDDRNSNLPYTDSTASTYPVVYIPYPTGLAPTVPYGSQLATYGYQPYATAHAPGAIYGYQPYATAQAPAALHGSQPYATVQLPVAAYGYQPNAIAQLPFATYGYQPYITAQAPAASQGYQPYATAQVPSATYGYQPYATAQAPAASQAYQPYDDSQVPAPNYGYQPIAAAQAPAASQGYLPYGNAQAPAASYGYLPNVTAQVPSTTYGYQQYDASQVPPTSYGHQTYMSPQSHGVAYGYQPYYMGQAQPASDGYQTNYAGQIPAITYVQQGEITSQGTTVPCGNQQSTVSGGENDGQTY